MPGMFSGEPLRGVPACKDEPKNSTKRTTRCVTSGSGVRAKQRLALRTKAAFPGDKAGIKNAGIIQRAVPPAALSPFAPSDVIAIFAVGISWFPGRTKNALAGVARVAG